MVTTGAKASPDPDYSQWIGKQETRTEVLNVNQFVRMAASLNRSFDANAWQSGVQSLNHWLCFLPDDKQSVLGEDGHSILGGFLPPMPPSFQRMWAGNRVSFFRPMVLDTLLTRKSTIKAISEKSGRNGALVFVTVVHEICDVTGGIFITDEHDIVYRSPSQPGKNSSGHSVEKNGRWRSEITPDEMMLFRYSALTFNTHRIHYDYPYVTQTEGYPGLVVHGPLIAMLLVDLLAQSLPEQKLSTFEFRAIAPTFAGNKLYLDASPSDTDGDVNLWARDINRNVVMRATAKLTPISRGTSR